MNNHKTIRLIMETNLLPQVPDSLGNILNMLLEPCDYDMNSCINMFESNSDLETVLMNALNYTLTKAHNIENAKDAIIFLGAMNTRTVTIAFITRLLLPDSKGRTKVFDSQTYWKHSIGTSIACHMIAEKTGLSDKNKLFTYGLIHDIGITVLDICLPDHLDKLHELHDKGIHQIAAEKIVLGGITHADIGLWLCQEWGLPNEISEVVGYHHAPALAVDNKTEVEIMHLADSISANYYERLLGNESTFIYSAKIAASLGLDNDFINEVAKKLPSEIYKLSKTINFLTTA
ncbi:MAG: HDOD domain-containing protein [Clostridiaceae bacterium]|nr:HDOD domain-containing protein [Clostridiaceae bacterium]